MDPLGAAASVFAIITAAVHSAKVIHKILRDIKDGPNYILELSTKVNDLQGILAQLQNLNQSGNAFDQLKKSMAPCADDLAIFERKLAKIRNIPEGRWANIRRGVRLMLREDDFLSMNRKISHYIDILGVQVGIVGTGVHLGHSAVLDVLETKVVEIDDQIVQQSAVANRHSEKLCTIERCSTTHFNQSQAMHQGTQHEVRKVAGSVEELANMSAGKFNAIIGLLQQIQYVQSTNINSQGGHSDHSHSTLARTVRASKQKQYDILGDTGDSENIEVSESINRLYRLAKNKGATIHSMEAQTVIGDLEKVLEIASRDTDLRIQSSHGKRKREHAGFNSEWDVHHLKRTRGLLVSASAISVNQNEQLRLTLPPGSRSRNQYTCKTTHTDRWSLSILVRHRRLRKQIEEQVDQENAIFTGTLTITPTSQEVVRKQSLRLTVSLQQKVQYEGYYSLKPTLSFSAVLPLNSEVFKMAKDGNVEGLMKLLQDGEASLSDCDTAGRQLLHYACFGGKLIMCKFLLEKGADPDYIAIPYDSIRLCAPLMHSLGHQDGGEETLQGQRLLLDAGADPLLRVGSHKNALENALVFGPNDLLQLIIERGSAFFDINEPVDECNHSPLLYMAWRILDDDALIENMNLLIKKGANINATNTHGNTILHLFLEDPELRARSDYEMNRWQRILTCVLNCAIEAGFDMAAKNHAGFTASDYAYQWYIGKEWEKALTVCGLNAAEVCGWHYQNYVDTELAGGMHSYSPDFKFPELGVRCAPKGSSVHRKYELCGSCEQHILRRDYREQDGAIQWRAARRVWRPTNPNSGKFATC